MQRFSLSIAGFTADPFQTPPDRKVADIVVEDSGLARLTFTHPTVKSPRLYQSLEELKQVHCGPGSKTTLRSEP